MNIFLDLLNADLKEKLESLEEKKQMPKLLLRKIKKIEDKKIRDMTRELK